MNHENTSVEQRARERSRLLLRTVLRLVASGYLIHLACTQMLGEYLNDHEHVGQLVFAALFFAAATVYGVYALRFYGREVRRQNAQAEADARSEQDAGESDPAKMKGEDETR